MAGIWNQSQSQLYDANGKPLIGAKAYFYLGGTTTPITTYSAYALGGVNAQPNPLQTDGFGRWPSVFLDEADGFYHVRVATAQGVVIYDVDGVPIIGPAGGGGGGGDNPVDPNSVFKTGDLKERYDTDALAGWVRINGRTIGSATSGGTERANSDTQALFEHLWNKDSALIVVGGRGASASADWLANKQITLPDGRGSTLVGLDTMGNIAANKIAAAVALGWTGGEEKHTLTTAEIPSHKHTGVTDVSGGHLHQNPYGPSPSAGGTAGTGMFANGGVSNTLAAGDHTHSFETANQGGGAAHNNVQPSLAVTIYIKL